MAVDYVAQAQAAETTDQLDAIQSAGGNDQAVAAAVQQRRGELNARPVTDAPNARLAATMGDDGLGPNTVTEPQKPDKHYYIAADGKTKVNAWGEEKGSAEDKKRW